MKAVAGFALVAAVHAAGWQDTPVDPAKSTTTTAAESTWIDYDPSESTTTTKPAEETQTYWGDVPVDPTTTTAVETTWIDYDPSETTTEPAEETHTWSDYSVPSEETTTVTWSDYSVPVEETSTTTATWGDVSPAPVDPAHTWVDAPVGECKVVTVTKTGSWIWVPAPDPTSDAEASWTDYPVDPTTTAEETWSDYPVDPTTSAEATWSDYPVDPTSSTTTAEETWSDYTVEPTSTPSYSHPTYKPTTLSTSTKPTSSPSTPKPTAAVCPADNGKTLPAAGSCGGSFQINCGVKATPGAGTKFWQRKENEKIATLDACLAICNENALCESVLYVSGQPTSADNELCWQTSGLGPVTGSGYAQIAYKTGAKGKCAQSYTKA